jgi:hypothetical protein
VKLRGGQGIEDELIQFGNLADQLGRLLGVQRTDQLGDDIRRFAQKMISLGVTPLTPRLTGPICEPHSALDEQQLPLLWSGG